MLSSISIQNQWIWWDPFQSIPDLLYIHHWWSQWPLIPDGIMHLLPVPYFDTNLFLWLQERKWLWFKGHIHVAVSKSVLSPNTVVTPDVMKICFHQFIFFIFLHTANSLVCFSIQCYIFFSGGTGEKLDIDLMLVWDLGTFQSPACPLNLPMHKVYMLNIYKQCWIMVCNMNTENIWLISKDPEYCFSLSERLWSWLITKLK